LTARTATAVRFARAFVVLVLSASYFSHVFNLPAGAPLEAGMADWVDPNFINFLLEHWYHSLLTLANPTSPPMYFPARGTLGYSHGLVLFAPFYLAVRPWLHPFQAYNATIFLVLTTGTICFYAIARKFLKLGFVESLLMTAFFASSDGRCAAIMAAMASRRRCMDCRMGLFGPRAFAAFSISASTC